MEKRREVGMEGHGGAREKSRGTFRFFPLFFVSFFYFFVLLFDYLNLSLLYCAL